MGIIAGSIISCPRCDREINYNDEVTLNAMFLGLIYHAKCSEEFAEELIFDRGIYSAMIEKHPDYFSLVFDDEDDEE